MTLTFHNNRNIAIDEDAAQCRLFQFLGCSLESFTENLV